VNSKAILVSCLLNDCCEDCRFEVDKQSILTGHLMVRPLVVPIVSFLQPVPHYKAVSVMSMSGVLRVDYSLMKLKLISSGLVLRTPYSQ